MRDRVFLLGLVASVACVLSGAAVVCTLLLASAEIEGPNGSHIWMRPEPGPTNKLHLRGPNTYDPSSRTGSYSQINLYSDHLGLWGGTQPNGRALYLDQEALYPREDGTLDLGTATHRVGDVRLAGVLRSGSLAGESRRYACVDPDGTIVASLTPCTEGE